MRRCDGGRLQARRGSSNDMRCLPPAQAVMLYDEAAAACGVPDSRAQVPAQATDAASRFLASRWRLTMFRPPGTGFARTGLHAPSAIDILDGPLFRRESARGVPGVHPRALQAHG